MEQTLREIADSVAGDVIGDDQVIITGINSLDKASHGEISSFFDSRYEAEVKVTKASALLVSEHIDLFKGPQIVIPDPKLAYAKVVGIFAPPLPRFPGISRDAILSETATFGENVSIHPMVYIGEGVVIGDDVTLFSGVFIGDRGRVGDRTVVYPNVTIMHDCVIGNEVIIHAGSVIGSDGFGFVREGSANFKVPQIGIVQIDDQVEIGANNCIDRATLGKTWIKKGVKTDNLVHIAHNVVIGESTIVVAQNGIAGSVEIGRDVVLAGQVGIGDHMKIGDGAKVGSGARIFKTVSPGEVVSGNPAMPHRLWLRTRSLITRLPQLYKRLQGLEKKVEELELRTDVKR